MQLSNAVNRLLLLEPKGGEMVGPCNLFGRPEVSFLVGQLLNKQQPVRTAADLGYISVIVRTDALGRFICAKRERVVIVN